MTLLCAYNPFYELDAHNEYLLNSWAIVIFCANLCFPLIDQEVSKPGEQDAAGKSAGEAATESKVEATPST